MRLRPLLPVPRPSSVLRHKVGRWYLGRSHVTIASTYTVVADTLSGQPFFVPSRHTYDRMAVNVSTIEAGKSARLGVYAHDSVNVVPGALLLDAGSVSLGATGKQELVISLTLTPGWYWLGLLSNATGSARLTAARNANAGDGLLGYDDTLGADFHRYVSRSVVFGALPDPFGTVGVYETGEVPRIWLRA